MSENDYEIINISNQWYVVGNGVEIPVDSYEAGILIIEELLTKTQKEM